MICEVGKYWRERKEERDPDKCVAPSRPGCFVGWRTGRSVSRGSATHLDALAFVARATQSHHGLRDWHQKTRLWRLGEDYPARYPAARRGLGTVGSMTGLLAEFFSFKLFSMGHGSQVLLASNPPRPQTRLSAYTESVS